MAWRIGAWTVCMIFGFGSLISAASDERETFAILTQDFQNQELASQKSVLRQIGLLQLPDSVSFLVEVALSASDYPVEIRRDALKTMLALDSEHYRVVMRVLGEQRWDDKKLLEVIEQISLQTYYLSGWARSVDFEEPSWMLERKMAYLFTYLHKGGKLTPYDVATWDETQARTYLAKKIKSESGHKKTWEKMLKTLES